MNKKLLTAAIAVGLAAPMFAAQAGVKVYGIAQVEYNNEDRAGSDDVQGVDDNAGRSRIGVKFDEKLGNGLTAFGKFEYRVDPADSDSGGTSGDASGGAVSGALGQRDGFVGLKSKAWGSIAAGSFNSPYKTAGGVKWDPMAATHLQARRAGGMTGGTGVGGHNGFIRNAIYYTSPKANGFQGKFAFAPDETNAGATENVSDGDNDWSLALHYDNGPLSVVFAHNNNNNPAGTADEEMTKLGARYKFGNHMFAGQYEWIDDCDRACTGGAPGGGAYSSVGTGGDGEVWWLNYQFKSGNNIFTASFGNTEGDATGAPDNDYFMIGAIHKFSKKTRIFGGYTETDAENGPADREAWSIGMRMDF